MRLLLNIKNKLNSLKYEYHDNKVLLLIGVIILALVSIDFSAALDRSSSAPDGLAFIGLMSLSVFSSIALISLLVAAYMANNYFHSLSVTKSFSIILLFISLLFISLTILIHGEGSMVKWLIDLVVTVIGFIINGVT